MSVMRVEVVSNEENIYSGEASFVVVPPVMSLVRPGALRLTVPNSTEEILVAVSGGVLEVQPDRMMVLADVAVRSTEMDQARAEEARKVAEQRLSQAQDGEAQAKAQAALAAAIAELKTLDYLRSRKK